MSAACRPVLRPADLIDRNGIGCHGTSRFGISPFKGLRRIVFVSCQRNGHDPNINASNTNYLKQSHLRFPFHRNSSPSGISKLLRGNHSTRLSSSTSQTEIWEPPSTWNDYPYLQAALGIATLLIIERALSTLVTALHFPLPAPVLMLGVIAAFMATNSPYSIEFYEWMKPAVLVFDAWMPLLFAPSVAGIVMAPLPVGGELAKAALVLGGTYLYTLYGGAAVGHMVQKYFSQKENTLPKKEGMTDEEKIERISSAAKFWTKKVISKGAQAFASAAISSDQNDLRQAAINAANALDKLSDKIKTTPLTLPSPPRNAPLLLARGAAVLLVTALLFPFGRSDPILMAPGLLLLTISAFIASKNQMPSALKPWVTPTVSSGALMAIGAAVYGALFLGSWRNGVQLYNSGAGSILVMFIAPAVAALGFKVRTQRTILQKSMKQLFIVCLAMAPSCLVIGALLGRLIGANPSVTLSLVPSTTTLGLAREMIPMLNCTPGLVVAGVTIAGTLGMVSAQKTLDFFEMEGPVTRGASVGSAAHTLGASGLLAEEPQAAAVAGLALALKGSLSVAFLCIPAFRDFIIFAAGKL